MSIAQPQVERAWRLQKSLFSYPSPAFVLALRHYAIPLGYTRPDLQAQTGIATTTIGEWLRGSGPKHIHVDTVAHGLGVDPDEFGQTGRALERLERAKVVGERIRQAAQQDDAQIAIEAAEEIRAAYPTMWRTIGRYWTEALEEEEALAP